MVRRDLEVGSGRYSKLQKEMVKENYIYRRIFFFFFFFFFGTQYACIRPHSNKTWSWSWCYSSAFTPTKHCNVLNFWGGEIPGHPYLYMKPDFPVI